MDATIVFISHLARAPERIARRVRPTLGGLILLAGVVLCLAFLVGAASTDLMAPAPEGILAAPFRW
jgi:hypothetical protein